MTTIRLLFLSFLLLIVSSIIFSQEVTISKNFSRYGIETIGIFSDGYYDSRYFGDINEIYVKATKENDVLFFREDFCNYAGVTPVLTDNTMYPVISESSKWASNIDKLIYETAEKQLTEQGWQTKTLNNAGVDNLRALLQYGKKSGVEAVLLIRYYRVYDSAYLGTYKSSLEHIDLKSQEESFSASIGPLIKGIALLPAIELFSTETAERLWSSAYFTAHPNKRVSENYDKYQNNFFDFFQPGEAPEKGAVDRMITIALFNPETSQFPDSSISEERDSKYISEKIASYKFNSDDPYFQATADGGLSYGISYIPSFNIYNSEHSDLDFQYDSLLVHKFTYSAIAFINGNIIFEPLNFHLSFSVFDLEDVSFPLEDYYYYLDNDDIWDISFKNIFMGNFIDFKHLIRLGTPGGISSILYGLRASFEWFQTPKIEINHAGSWQNAYDNQYFTGLIPFLSDEGEATGRFINISFLAGFMHDSFEPYNFTLEFSPVGLHSQPMLSIAGTIYLNRFIKNQNKNNYNRKNCSGGYDSGKY